MENEKNINNKEVIDHYVNFKNSKEPEEIFTKGYNFAYKEIFDYIFKKSGKNKYKYITKEKKENLKFTFIFLFIAQLAIVIMFYLRFDLWILIPMEVLLFVFKYLFTYALNSGFDLNRFYEEYKGTVKDITNRIIDNHLVRIDFDYRLIINLAVILPLTLLIIFNESKIIYRKYDKNSYYVYKYTRPLKELFKNDDKDLNIPSKYKGKDVVKIRKEAFINTKFENLIVSGSIKTIPYNAFGGNNNLRKIILKEGIENIEEYAFHDLKSLEVLVLPSSLKKIEGAAFIRSGNLGRGIEKIVFPDNLTIIEDKAFYSSKIKEVYLNKNTKLNNDVFNDSVKINYKGSVDNGR